MDAQVNRLLMAFEQLFRRVNKEKINPVIEELCIDDLEPIAELVARSRAHYLKEVYALSKKYAGSESFPSEDEMANLKMLRTRYIDLADASQSFEISIQRGYLDLK